LEYLVTGALVFSYHALSAQEASVFVELDTNRALIGDQLKLNITVDKPFRARVVFPQLQDSLGYKIEIINVSPVDTAQHEGGRMLLSQDVLLTVFDTGFYGIPALDIVVFDGEKRDTLKSRPLTFEIVALPTDTTIREIKPNLKAPVSLAEMYPFILGALVVALLAWLLVYYLRKRLAHKPEVKQIRTEPPDVTALRRLEQLRDEKPWLNRHVKLYYINLTEILREYIENRFNIMAMEQTTDEILDALKVCCNESDRKLLAGLLRLADLVKFAKVVPEPSENSDQLETAIVFVRNSAEKKAEKADSAVETPQSSLYSNAT
jgi:hypothetical protein